VNGVLCFNFTDDGGEGYDGYGEDDTGKEKSKKKLKNEASKRIVPIHSKLIELGFLDVLNAQKKRVTPTQLFPKFTYEKGNGYGRNLGRWFGNLLTRLELKTEKLVFHSIRHTVARKLRNARAGEADIANILGHSQKGVTMGIYAPELDIQLMQENIEALDYGDVAFKPVVPQGDEIDPLAIGEI
jgi:integrase